MIPGIPEPQRESAALAAALIAMSAAKSHAAATVEYRSRGCVLMIGDASHARAVIPRLPESLRKVAFVTGPTSSDSAPAGVTWVAGQIAELNGWLGHFTARSHGADGQLLDCGPFSRNSDGFFDLVIDLGPQPLIAREVPPLGYFAPGTDAVALSRALTELPRFIGTYRKPRFFDYDARICAHGASSVAGCTRCLEACPTGAIAARGDRVEIDPYLCQGCGGCTTVCPTGAVSYTFPTSSELLGRLRIALGAYRGAGGISPVVMVHDPAGAGTANANHDLPCLPIEVPGLGAFGPDAWLGALAYGAHQVLMVTTAGTDSKTAAVINQELEAYHVILSAIGEDPRRLTHTQCADARQFPETASLNDLALRPRAWLPAAFEPADDKRTSILAFLDHLNAQAGRSAEVLTLPHGTPFGALQADPDTCTVCHACVNLCPTDALAAGSGAILELLFTEQRCVQCGICATGCPEGALRLVPRIMFNREQRGAAQLLAQSEMFRCSECGEPFISRAVLERSIQHVRNHPMFADSGADLLRLCMPCRQKRLLTS